jgi:hypothetical protein
MFKEEDGNDRVSSEEERDEIPFVQIGQWIPYFHRSTVASHFLLTNYHLHVPSIKHMHLHSHPRKKTCYLLKGFVS